MFLLKNDFLSFLIATDISEFDANAHRFDLDRTTGNLYFSDKYSPFVGIITRSGEYVKILDDFGFESLRDIAVHPGKG